MAKSRLTVQTTQCSYGYMRLFSLQGLSWAPPAVCLSFVSCLALDVLGIELAARPDKSQYTLWNPVPASLMRELSADRPDKTDSPYTVDAGHYQIEMDFANWT